MTRAPARWRRLPGRALHGSVIAAFSTLLAFPFVWMLVTAFKRTSDLYNLENNPFLFHQPPTLEHLRFLLTETLCPRWLLNTA